MPPKQVCHCPPELQKICKHRSHQPSSSRKAGPEDIIAALNFADQVKILKKKSQPPKLTVKKFKPLVPKSKPTIHMVPPMDERLKYLMHCDPEPYKRTFEKRPRIRYNEVEVFDSAEDLQRRLAKEHHDYILKQEREKCLVGFQTGPKSIKHTASDKSIIHLASPKTSGTFVRAQPAKVKPSELRPPIPAKSGFDLFGPHSGIVLNRDKEYAVEGVEGGAGIAPRKPKKQKLAPCAKGGVCTRRRCKKRKCRKYAAMRRRQMARAVRGGRGRERPCRFAGHSGPGHRGARDGKPRARSSKGYRGPGDGGQCGLDDVESPEYPVIPKGLHKGSFKTHSLTILKCTKDKRPDVHYGILMGTYNMYSDKFGPRSRGRCGLAQSIMSYCLAYHYHPKQWTTKLIDTLLEAGETWYLQLADKLHDHSQYMGMCEVVPFGKTKVLILNRKKMSVNLGEPEIVGYAMSTDPTVYNLCRGLKAFFCGKEHRACVLLTRVLKIAIWRDKICYYVFDPAGRDAKGYSNFAQGKAALINVLDLNGVADIIMARSIVEDQKYVLAPIKLVAMVSQQDDDDLESEPEPNAAEKAKMSFKILNHNQAIVTANIHMGDRCFEETKFQQALPIAVAALTYAKISPPNTWYSKTLDKIIRLGNKLYLDFKIPNSPLELTIDNIPNQFVLGPFMCEIIIYRDRTKGQLFTTKECIHNIRRGLADFFDHEYSSGIIDFNNYKIAVWKQKDMYYLFDPYPRTKDGERALTVGKACCLMLLNTDAVADSFTKCWDFLPETTQFYIHAFKVLKLKQKPKKGRLTVKLSQHRGRGRSRSRSRSRSRASSLHRQELAAGPRGDGIVVLSATAGPLEEKRDLDEEYMGEIVSLVDSIAEDFVPPIPYKCKMMPPEEEPPKPYNLDSPTVSVTQVVPPWPRPRDKTNEPAEPDPDPEPTPPPTPPPPIPPEGPEEEAEEEELDEEALMRKAEEEARRRAEEEEARRKAEELPPPMPPPPPTPQLEDEGKPGAATTAKGSAVRLGAGTAVSMGEGAEGAEGGEELSLEPDDMDMEPVQVDRYLLLTEDAKKRYKMRARRRKFSQPLTEDVVEELEPGAPKKHNFTNLPDQSQIIIGTKAITERASDQLPFVAVMAIVTSYKYAINTWTIGLVDFVVSSGKQLYDSKKARFQSSPMHIIPKISIGHQAYYATIDVAGEGPTWRLEEALGNKFFAKHDRGILTTPFYSCAIFKKGDYFYLYDGSQCNSMGIRKLDPKAKAGKACFMRFKKLSDLVARIQYNKDGKTEDSQFILSTVTVRQLLPTPRYKLPEDYDYGTRSPKKKESKATILEEAKSKDSKVDVDTQAPVPVGYQDLGGVIRIEGTGAQPPQTKAGVVGPDHYICTLALLMAAMHPLRGWTSDMVDICIEKGNEVAAKATSNAVCEKRCIKNIIMDGKFIDLNIKKIVVVNENPEKYLEQYVKAVLNKLRYVLIQWPKCDLAIVQTNGMYHLFDPCAQPMEEPEEMVLKQIKRQERENMTQEEQQKSLQEAIEMEKEKKRKEKKMLEQGLLNLKNPGPVAGWTMYRTMVGLINRLKITTQKRLATRVDEPEFYTFELVSVKPAPTHAMLNFKLSPLFKPDVNPNEPYLKKQKKPRRIVDEKMYWLKIDTVPWSRGTGTNDLGIKRNTPAAKWKAWDIEFPGDLYSLWGTIHPKDKRFDEETRGKQYLAACFIACGFIKTCNFAAWTGSFLDGIVIGADDFQQIITKKVGANRNYELKPEDYANTPAEVFPYKFTFKVQQIIFGFVYNLLPDRFNLSKALCFFFEKYTMGILTSTAKNLAFGKIGASYFMFDPQSYGAPLFNRSAYILKCESLNRLIYVMTIALNLRAHNQQFHLYSVTVEVAEAKPNEKESVSAPPSGISSGKSSATTLSATPSATPSAVTSKTSNATISSKK